MSPYVLISAAAAGASYTLIPGPAFLALLGIGAGQGRRAGAGFLVGHFAGDILWATLALLAIIGAHAISPLFFDVLGLICGAYLCWLGFGALRARAKADGSLAADVRRPLVRGLAFGLTNPKGYPVSVAMFTALLSGSSEALDWTSMPALLLAACCGFVVADVILIAIVGAGVVRAFYRRHAVWVSRGSGLIFIGFGLHALWEALPGIRGRTSV
jgi:threonine/homoserine/homoserine lactone efflux protein